MGAARLPLGHGACCARSLLSGTAEDLAVLLQEVIEAVGLPVAGVISDGQHSIRKAVAMILPTCRISSAISTSCARPRCRSSRPTGNAKKELKKGVRGVRPIERAVEGRTDPEAQVVRGLRGGRA